ncbi:thiamine diphosphokinase [Chloroflexi bacterium TSY]|nr:thiamine diphosphokinase [Chloroflexi bacterium TSY]
MRAIVFINGLIEDYAKLAALVHENDFLVGADGGTRHCLAIGRTPHLVVGDLDSLESHILNQLAEQDVEVERHPAEKDATDLELAIESALRHDADEIVLVGALGGRLDQTLANLLILAQSRWSIPIHLVEGEQTAQIVRGGENVTLTGSVGDTVSVLPLCDEVTGLTFTGLKYPLDNFTMPFGSTRGISNEIVDHPVTIRIATGTLLAVHLPANTQ